MMTPHDSHVRHALRHLSIRGWTPHAGWVDVPAWGAGALDIVERVRQHCEVGRGEQAERWRLNDAARREAFSDWPLEDVRHALITQPESDRDPVNHALSILLGVCPFDLGTATAQQLSDLLAARAWLPQPWVLPQALINLSASQLHLASVQDDYRTLTQHGLIGRTSIIDQVEKHISAVDNPTVYLTGKGGSGKSTLLAMLRLSLQHRSDCIVVHLDFDRPELMMKDSTALDRELIAAVGRSVPALADESIYRLAELRQFAADEVRGRLKSVPENLRHLRQVVSESHSTAYASESIGSTAQSLLSVFLERTAMLPKKRLVVLLDTFERVEGAGFNAVSTVSHWLDSLSSMLPSWSIARVLSGRGQDIVQMDVSLKVSLDDLNVNDAHQLLLKKDCPPKIAKKLATLLPSRTPLVLLLAADAIRRCTDEARNKLLEELKAGQIPAWMIEGYFYQRILQHLDDPVARKYAIASVILPELSPELVARVLIAVTEPDKQGNHAYARQVFDALKNVGWLIVQTNSGYLRLRKELRSTMLKIINDSSTGSGPYRKLRRRAMVFHRRQGTDWHKAMYLYHEAILTADKRGRVSREILTGVSQSLEYLNDFADDLPRQVALLLSRKADESIDLYDAIEMLDDNDWRRLMEGDGQKAGKGQYLVDKVDATQALELYRRRPTAAQGNPPTYILQAMCDTARWHDPELSVDGVLDDLIRMVVPGPKVWRETLLRLQWFTRLVMFRHSAGHTHNLPGELEWALHRILERCSLYGITTQLADTFAMAEAIYDRPFFREDIFNRPSKRSDRTEDELRARSARLNTWRNLLMGGKYNPLVLPWELCVARPEVMYLLEKHYSSVLGNAFAQLEHLVEGTPGAYPTLNGKPWVDFQRHMRDLNDYSPPSDADAPMSKNGGFSFIYSLPVPIGVWPEFYRPLRQVWIDDLSRDSVKLKAFANIFNTIVPVIPKELSEDNFVNTVSREPRIWLFVIAQHADRSGKLLEMLDVMIDQGLCSGRQLINARDALRVWQQRFLNRGRLQV